VGHGLDLVDELKQHPYSQDDALVGLDHGVESQVVTAGDIRNSQLPFQVLDNPLRCLRALVPQQPDHLRFG